MTPTDFRALLVGARLTQRRLAVILDVSPITVNRWCDDTRPDRLTPPTYAVKFVQAWMMLTPEQRDTLSID